MIVFWWVAIAAADRVWLEPQRPTSTQGNWYPRAVEVVTGGRDRL